MKTEDMQTNLKQDALKILEAGLQALKPENILNQKIWSRFKLPPHKKIYVIGSGKGVRFLAKQIEEILGDKLVGGYVNDISQLPLRKIKVNKASHPLPDKSSILGTNKIVSLLKRASQEDLIICLFAGGSSALLSWPTLALEKVIDLYDKLLKSGATISEMVIVRKHIDKIKGGGLATLIYPRPCLSLIVSDVPGNDISTIASGPTVFDKSTKKDAEEILKKYGLPKLPFIETPKDKKIFKNVKNILLATNGIALSEMKKMAKSLKYEPNLLCDDLEEDAESVGQILFKKTKPGQVLIAGGETTVKVHGNGKGGRNTHLCLSALKSLPENTILLSVDSDGQDNTDAAGAIISQETIKKAQKLNLNPKEYLRNFDSYNFFKQTEDLIFTGELPINVADLILVLKKDSLQTKGRCTQ